MGEERIKLLLVDSNRDRRCSGISAGVAGVIGKWPSYLTSALWCSIVFLVLFICTLLGTFIYGEKRAEGCNSEILYRQIKCTGLNAESFANNTFITKGKMPIKSPTNIFFLLTKPLDKREACSVESVLRACPERKLVLMYFDIEKSNDFVYERLLEVKFSNLEESFTTRKDYFLNTPHKYLIRESDNISKDMLIIALLIIWQHGGMVMSPHLIMKSRTLLDIGSDECYIDQDVLYCPKECSSYIKTLLKLVMECNYSDGNTVINKSLEEFCKTPKAVNNGCNGVKMLTPNDISPFNGNSSMFIKFEDWMNMDPLWQSQIKLFCPLIFE